jgi:coenzyme F420-reducing hydrogenase delta subunit
MDKFEPTIVAFCCHFCAYTAADLAGTMRLQYPPNVRIIRLPCTGKVDVRFLLEAFEKGADGVYVAGCLEGDCHFLTGNFRAKKRVAYAKRLLDEIGFGGERLEMYNMSAAMGPRFAEVAREMTEKIRKLGPSPIKKSAKGMEHGAEGKEQSKKPKPGSQDKSIGAKGA